VVIDSGVGVRIAATTSGDKSSSTTQTQHTAEKLKHATEAEGNGFPSCKGIRSGRDEGRFLCKGATSLATSLATQNTQRRHIRNLGSKTMMAVVPAGGKVCMPNTMLDKNHNRGGNSTRVNTDSILGLVPWQHEHHMCEEQNSQLKMQKNVPFQAAIPGYQRQAASYRKAS